MGRFARSWELVKLCWGVLQQDKELVVFPIVSLVCVLIVTATFLVPGIFSGFWQQVADGGVGAAVIVLIVVFYLVQYFVIIFFNAALISAARIRLGGGDPTLGDGLRGAWAHLPAILGYAAIAATVGLVLSFIRQQGGAAGGIVAGLGGMAWNVLTFLAVPVLVIEGVGPIEAIKRSGGLLKKTWGEQLIGSASISLVFGLLGVAVMFGGGLLGALIIGAGVVWAGVAVILVALAAVLVVALLGATLHGIYAAALYGYAVGGDSGVFGADVLAAAFAPRRPRRGL
jgi:hypothetical protein